MYFNVHSSDVTPYHYASIISQVFAEMLKTLLSLSLIVENSLLIIYGSSLKKRVTLD